MTFGFLLTVGILTVCCLLILMDFLGAFAVNVTDVELKKETPEMPEPEAPKELVMHVYYSANVHDPEGYMWASSRCLPEIRRGYYRRIYLGTI